MESIKKFRIPIRSSFTKTANKIEECMKTEVIDYDELYVLFSQLNDKWIKLEGCDVELIELLKKDPNCTDVEFEKEYESIEVYSERYIALKARYERQLQMIKAKHDTSICENNSVFKRKYKLPEIELKKFSGEVSEWLGFWGQFKKIDEDDEISPEDKLLYLIQSTVAGSKARDIVQSFPPTADNYKLAIEHLKSRFGKDEILLEVYVRELLQLVLSNAVSPKKDTNLLKLYDRLETHLRALEVLGVTSDGYAAMLYPLVEACLPEEMLRTWQRNFSFMTSKSETQTPKLEILMQFLRNEVEGEERISLVRQGFGFEKQKRNVLSVNKDVPTASALMSSFKKPEDYKKNNVCIYCENKHNLEDCKSFQKISLDEKRKFLSRKGCCFICMRMGHISKMCKNPLRCSNCSKKHRAVMCPEFSTNQNTNLKTDHVDKVDIKDRNLSNKSCMQEVVMQTLNVRLRGKNEEFVIRALIDTGSQKSYLKKETALAIGYTPLGEEKVNHCLFGGIEATETHQRYRVFLTGLSGNYKCNFEVYDQENICSDIPKIKNGPWLKELNYRGISLSDCENETKGFKKEEIQLLIGSDVAGKLLTGNILQLTNGLVAIETELGWTLMGKIPFEKKCSETFSVLSLLCKEVKIRSLSNPDEWNHVPGHLNPADLPSRGCSPDTLISKRWWEGPSWLFEAECNWPKSELSPCPDVVNSEKKKMIVTSTQFHLDAEMFYSRFSSYIRILRVTAWIYRFYSNAKKKDTRNQGELSVKEIKNAEFLLMKLIQKEEFPKGIDNNIRQLHPVVDENGLIRVKTQIFQRKDKKNFRFPILLPSNHYIVHKLIAWKHKELKHAGVQVLMNHLRENFWILRSRKTIQRVLKQCIQCKRYTAPSFQVESPPLPEDRVRDTAVFEISGVDLAGPLFLKGGQKCWVVLYTCAVYRTIHLELTTSLSSGAFLQTLRRFIARRGRPLIIYSDNGTNFVGAANAMSEIDWTNFLKEVNLREITWKFIPPASPWWGGWWERLVSMIKFTFRRVLGRASLHYEELYTLLCDTESLINSRPLTPLSEDVEDLIPLTPDMFLHELKEVGVPDIDHIDKVNFRKRYLYLQKVRDDLRKRFRTEYLGQLKYTKKPAKTGPMISVGDVVLVGSNNQKRLQWPLARVTEVYPGKDGLVRLAKVKSKFGEQMRPVQRLYPLEIAAEDGSVFRGKLLRGKSVRQDDAELKVEISDVPENKLCKSSVKKAATVHRATPKSGQPIVTSRCGRAVKPPRKLDL